MKRSEPPVIVVNAESPGGAKDILTCAPARAFSPFHSLRGFAKALTPGWDLTGPPGLQFAQIRSFEKAYPEPQFQYRLRPRLWHTINMPYWFDGNNLIGQSAAAAKADSRARKAFLSALHSYHRSGGGKFLVCFDGDDVDRSASPPGISIRYSAPVSTDEAILQRLREIKTPSEVIVVTNDRELQTRCRNAGAAVLTWNEFASRMQSRRVSRKNRNEQTEHVDVDEWMRYFGYDRK